MPPWPKGGKEPTDPERAMWNRLWTTQAQAAIWEEQGLHDTVAQYVRTQRSFMDAYSRPSSNMGTLAKQLREELLLAPAALQRARIAIEGSEEAQALDSIRGTASAAYQPPPDHPRNRLRVVMPQPAAEEAI